MQRVFYQLHKNYILFKCCFILQSFFRRHEYRAPVDIKVQRQIFQRLLVEVAHQTVLSVAAGRNIFLPLLLHKRGIAGNVRITQCVPISHIEEVPMEELVSSIHHVFIYFR